MNLTHAQNKTITPDLVSPDLRKPRETNPHGAHPKFTFKPSEQEKLKIRQENHRKLFRQPTSEEINKFHLSDYTGYLIFFFIMMALSNSGIYAFMYARWKTGDGVFEKTVDSFVV